MRNCPQCGTECSGDHRFCPACGFPIGALRTAAGDPLIGRTLGGAYVILENVGAGGMGRVYRAEQVSLGKTVAVKVIHPHLISDESATSRFYTEARAASRLNHPNSVSVLEFGRTDDGLLYLVMEYLRGKDLAHILWEQGPLPAARAANILRQALAALSEAHELDIIHRDIKPENILIEPLRTGGDFVKVVDFGLAKVRADVAPSITMPGIVCGTPDYMAPEQGRGDPLDARSDLYACGVLLFQVLTGRLPFEAEAPTQIVLMHMTDPPPDPRSIIPTIPDSIAEITLKALSKEPIDRHQSAVEFAEALAGVIREAEMRRASVAPPSNGSAAVAPGPPCPSCGQPLAPGVKFCGECGARVPTAARRAGSIPPPRPRSSERPPESKSGTTAPTLPFVGRTQELARMEATRQRALRGTLASIRIVGETGAGKTRLVSEFIERAKRLGDHVVRVGPDVTWANVSYAPIAQCVRACLEMPLGSDPIAWLDERAAPHDELEGRAVRAGFQELFSEKGPENLEGRARREAVVRALAFALGEASTLAASGIVVLAIEQLHRIDTASLAVLTSLTSRALPVRALLVGTHTPRIDPRWLHSETVALKGLSYADAQGALQHALMMPASENAALLEPTTDDVLPLQLDQLVRWTLEGGGAAPARLVDLVSARFERLPPLARRTTQVLALLGAASAATLGRVLGEDLDPQTRTVLRQLAWIESERTGDEDVFRISHALLREVAEASIPATARRELHQRCAEVLQSSSAPIEARAIHAVEGDDPFQALVLLERIGDRAMIRGDDLGAAHAFRRGLERARSEVMRGELDEPERAMSIFARKLADALMRTGDAAEAEGVLREAIELLPRTNPEWARIQGSLARALYARGRTPEAMRAMDDAVKTARRADARLVAVELLLAQAELDETLGALRDAIAHLRTAETLFREATRISGLAGSGPASPEAERAQERVRIQLLTRLARTLRLAGEEMSAGEPLLEARDAATRLGLLSDRAACDAEGAERAEQLGDRRAAAFAWRKAAQSASEAGDVLGAAGYLERERRLGVSQVSAAETN